MVEHLTRERIAALLDEPDAGDGAAHLDVCPECAGEFEAMSRMRMALSGMPDLSAPDEGWERIRQGLRVGGTPDLTVERSGRTVFARNPWGPLLTAAAVAVLFLAGLGVGRVLGPDGTLRVTAGNTDGPAGAAEGALPAGQDPAETMRLAAEYPEYLRSVAGLRALREGGPTTKEIAADPALAAERLARLDALIEASREALQAAPADPALNDFLFDVVDERASVAGQLDQTIRHASMEY